MGTKTNDKTIFELCLEPYNWLGWFHKCRYSFWGTGNVIIVFAWCSMSNWFLCRLLHWILICSLSHYWYVWIDLDLNECLQTIEIQPPPHFQRQWSPWDEACGYPLDSHHRHHSLVAEVFHLNDKNKIISISSLFFILPNSPLVLIR